MNRNTSTPLKAEEYDGEIGKTLPYHEAFYQQTISVVKKYKGSAVRWLDIGCGTGKLTQLAGQQLPDAEFVLADPSEEMLECARQAGSGSDYLCKGSQEIDFEEQFDVVTAIQVHHYLHENEREAATRNVYRALRRGGMYITFENVIPECEQLWEMELQRWGDYQREHGKSEQQVREHLARCGTAYFPLTVPQHIQLLRETGFRIVHVFWCSYLQAGFYAIKE